MHFKTKSENYIESSIFVMGGQVTINVHLTFSSLPEQVSMQYSQAQHRERH